MKTWYIYRIVIRENFYFNFKINCKSSKLEHSFRGLSKFLPFSFWISNLMMNRSGAGKLILSILGRRNENKHFRDWLSPQSKTCWLSMLLWSSPNFEVKKIASLQTQQKNAVNTVVQINYEGIQKMMNKTYLLSIGC